MVTRLTVGLALIIAATPAAAQAPRAPLPHWRHHYHHRVYPLPLPFPPFQPQIIPPPPAPEIEIAPTPPGPEPTPPPLPYPGGGLPGGMSITVTKILHEDRNKDRARSSDPINRPKQAAEELAACWSPPIPPKGETVEITLRFSFNNRGGVLGAPRVTYVKAPKGSSAEAVRESILDAIKTCSPLRFTRSMATSAPGYPLSVRFIGRRAQDGDRE
jgi:hypothetical protein